MVKFRIFLAVVSLLLINLVGYSFSQHGDKEANHEEHLAKMCAKMMIMMVKTHGEECMMEGEMSHHEMMMGNKMMGDHQEMMGEKGKEDHKSHHPEAETDSNHHQKGMEGMDCCAKKADLYSELEKSYPEDVKRLENSITETLKQAKSLLEKYEKEKKSKT